MVHVLPIQLNFHMNFKLGYQFKFPKSAKNGELAKRNLEKSCLV